MTRRVKTHVRLGIHSGSLSNQSPLCTHEEILGPYLPIVKFCGVSPQNVSEKTLGKISDFYFSPRKQDISRKGSFTAKRKKKKAFFLG